MIRNSGSSYGEAERNDYSDENRSFTTRGVGMEWAPTGRTRISAEHGKRFFGWGHRYSFRHRTQGVSYSLLATKEDTTNLEQLTRNSVNSLFERFSDLLLAQYPDPHQRAEQVRQLLNRTGISQEPIPQAGFLTSAVQLERRIEGSAALIGARNTWTLSAYHRNTQPLTLVNDSATANSLAAAEVSETGLSVNLNHRLSAQTSVSALASWQRNRGAGNDPLEIISRRIEMMVARQLSPSTTGSIGFRLVRFDGGGVPTANDYRENAIFGGVSHQF
ncbi:MAG: TIGR03016 family PEP-CTERM system-associated outer membrane protein [Sterolibacteriaceae bacterium]|nr:TIGR03016 family PEP-CTERM system-associated outer membrane protein [Candidatus Methylophosphatis haderslevensis]